MSHSLAEEKCESRLRNLDTEQGESEKPVDFQNERLSGEKIAEKEEGNRCEHIKDRQPCRALGLVPVLAELGEDCSRPVESGQVGSQVRLGVRLESGQVGPGQVDNYDWDQVRLCPT